MKIGELTNIWNLTVVNFWNSSLIRYFALREKIFQLSYLSIDINLFERLIFSMFTFYYSDSPKGLNVR